jgi:threonine synthase
MLDGMYNPKPSKASLSNAMDVGNPSNFIRIQELYKHDFSAFKNDFSAYSFSDEETHIALKELYTKNQYIAEPHGAIGFLGLKEEIKKNNKAVGVFLETAHPIKFSDTVEPALEIRLPIPTQIESIMNKEKKTIKIKTYTDLKNYLS